MSKTNYPSNPWMRLTAWFRRQGIVVQTLTTIIFFIYLVPVIWSVSATFKTRIDYMTNTASLIPVPPTLLNYEYTLTKLENLPIYFRNSVIVTLIAVTAQVLFSALAGYAFAQLRFPFRDLIFRFLIFSMLIPLGGMLFALYEEFTFFKIRNIVGLVLLFCTTSPGMMLIMRQSFASIPRAMIDAATMDGASPWQFFWFVGWPIAMSSSLVVATSVFVLVWGDYLYTTTLVDQEAHLTLAVGVQKILPTGGGVYETALSAMQFRGKLTPETASMAILWFAALPALLVYAALQRWFMRGLLSGAIKG